MNIHVQVSDDPLHARRRIGSAGAQYPGRLRRRRAGRLLVRPRRSADRRQSKLCRASTGWRRRRCGRAQRCTTSPMALEAAGTCPMAVDDYVAYCRAIQERDEPRVWCVTLADGRVLRVRQAPTPDGGWVAIHADVSEARETRRLREACETLQALIDRVPGHLWVKDCDSRFVFANQAQATDYGRAAVADLVGLTDFDFRAPEMAKKRRRNELEVIFNGEPIVDRDETLVAADGRRASVSDRRRRRCATPPVGSPASSASNSTRPPPRRPSRRPTNSTFSTWSPPAQRPKRRSGRCCASSKRNRCGVVASVLRLDPGGERLRYAARSNSARGVAGGERGPTPRLRRARFRRSRGAARAERQRRRRRRFQLGGARRPGRRKRLRRLLGDAHPRQGRRPAGRLRRLRARVAGADPRRRRAERTSPAAWRRSPSSARFRPPPWRAIKALM